MKTNSGQNTCTTIGSTTCMKYTGPAVPELDIYCDEDLNDVLNIIFVRVTEALKTKGLDLSSIQGQCINISNSDKSNIATVINKIINKVCELEIVASGEQTINTVKVVLNTIDSAFWSDCINQYSTITGCDIQEITLYDLLEHINSEICRNITLLTERVDALELNSLTTNSTQYISLLDKTNQLQADVDALNSSVTNIDSDYNARTIQSTNPTSVSGAINMLIEAVDKVKTELFSSAPGISNINYEIEGALSSSVTSVYTGLGGSSGDINFSNIESSIESLMRVIVQMNNACKLVAVSATVSGRTTGPTGGAPTGITIQLANYTTATPVIAKINSGGSITDNLSSSFNTTTGVVSLPSAPSSSAYTTIVTTDRIRITQGSCVAFISAPDMTTISPAT